MSQAISDYGRLTDINSCMCSIITAQNKLFSKRHTLSPMVRTAEKVKKNMPLNLS